MTDVSESGRWTFRQSRPLRSVTAGFTAFEEGDVLVAKITPCLENGKGAHAVGLENGIGFGSTEFHVLRARSGNEPRFVFHLTQWRRFRRAAEGQMVGSAGQQRVPRAFFDEFLVSDFSADQQARIAQILDTLDTAIHETEAIVAKLKTVKRGLLHDLLTRGIDADGELRPPQAEAPHLYKPSPLGWIPKQWQVGNVATMTDILDSLRVPVNEAERSKRPGDVPYYGANGQQGWIDRPLFNESLILLAEDGGNFDDFAFRPIAYRIDGPSWINNHAHILRAKTHCSQAFVFFSLVHRDIRRYISGGTRTKLTAKELKSIELTCPRQSEQAEIAQRLESVETRLRDELQSREKLTREKAGLMDDLLTGRVRVTPLLAAESEGSV
ncbi:MAG TPA: hypothetical protein DCY89_01160 [Gammaproteobacteria bacterium]|nr:hypothetical protein [Gammaproteobacteria bacterium]